MDKQDYINIKTFLKTYEFGVGTSFIKLYSDFIAAHQFYGFKLFVRIARALGVSSVVRKHEGVAVRRLEYAPGDDKYLEIYIDSIKRCTACEGNGYIKEKINLTP